MVALVALTVALCDGAVAQVIRGQVVDSASGEPVPRGFVILVGEDGADRGRALTDGFGRFAFATPPGPYHVRSERIGFRVGVSDAFRLTMADTLDVRILINRIPSRLADLEVRRQTECRPAWERIDTGTLWEEARKALMAAMWTEEQGLYRYRVHQFTTARQRRQRAVTTTAVVDGTFSRPFRADNLDRFTRFGYIRRENNRWTYYAPDATTLLDERFHRLHCFGTRMGSGDERGMLGLHFEPTSDRDVPEIEGTIWIDSATSQLRKIEYEYVGLPRGLPRGGYGGELVFSQLEEGTWIIRDWHITMPMSTQNSALQALTMEARQPAGTVDEGARIIEVFDPQGERRWVHPDAAFLAGTAFDSVRGGPSASQTIMLPGTGYKVVTDARGGFGLMTLLDGRFDVTLARLDSLGVTEDLPRVQLRPGDTASVAVAIPPLNRLHRAVCDRPLLANEYALVGRVVDANGAGVRRLHVEARFQERVARVRTDDAGWYRMCGLPAVTAVRVDLGDVGWLAEGARILFNRDQVIHETMNGEQTTILVPERIFRWDIVVDRR